MEMAVANAQPKQMQCHTNVTNGSLFCKELSLLFG